jgi:dethiobiotin synthetase
MTTTARGVFVAGTDTGVGKTVAAVALLHGLRTLGLRAVGMKPVAAGIEPSERVNADVAALARAGNVDAPLSDRNPYAFPPPIAPHLAARAAGVAIDLETIAAAYARLAIVADVIVVEGAGGVLVPLGDRADMLDIPRRLDIPVVLVVGIRLGCLNHALLSALALKTRGVRMAGWIASRIDPSMRCADDNVVSLASRLDAPLLDDIASPTPPAMPESALRSLGLAAGI